MTDQEDKNTDQTNKPAVYTHVQGNDMRVRINGKEIGSFSTATQPVVRKQRKPVSLDPNKFIGPSLKVSRAKRHLDELNGTIKDFFESNPYEIIIDQDPESGENVFRIRVHKALPTELSIISGEIVHNLRSALDQMVCGLVRANRKQARVGNGFPIMGSEKSFEKARIGKLHNVSVKADRFIRRLKPYHGGNYALWLLSELDNMDKHDDIVPVAAGQIQMLMKIGTPGVFITPDGSFSLFGGPPGSVPFGFQQGWRIPKGAKLVELIDDECEIYRASPELAKIPHNIQVPINITLGKSRVTNHEPLVETLDGLIQLVERVIYIVETRIL